MSDAMTPERLAEIRRRSTDAMQAYSTGTVGTPPNVDGLTLSEALDYVGESAEDVPDLLAEVERLREEVRSLQRSSQRNADAHMVTHRENARLREGVERLSNSWEDFDEPAPWRSPSYFAALNRCAYEARALLNPPTEGETDHE